MDSRLCVAQTVDRNPFKRSNRCAGVKQSVKQPKTLTLVTVKTGHSGHRTLVTNIITLVLRKRRPGPETEELLLLDM